MNIGILGKKVGMTRVFTDAGVSIPVTVVLAKKMRVSQIKRLDTEGYSAIQVTGGERKASRVNKALTGHFAKAEIEPGDMMAEFKIANPDEFTLGQVISVADVFAEGQFVDVTGTSKGKGFAGTVKRHNFRTQDASHGNSVSHRVPGSIGQNQTPGKVFKGKKMAGHLGNVQCTVQALEVIRVDNDRDLLLIKGAIPGAPGSMVKIKRTVKQQGGE